MNYTVAGKFTMMVRASGVKVQMANGQVQNMTRQQAATILKREHDKHTIQAAKA